MPTTNLPINASTYVSIATPGQVIASASAAVDVYYTFSATQPDADYRGHYLPAGQSIPSGITVAAGMYLWVRVVVRTGYPSSRMLSLTLGSPGDGTGSGKLTSYTQDEYENLLNANFTKDDLFLVRQSLTGTPDFGFSDGTNFHLMAMDKLEQQLEAYYEIPRSARNKAIYSGATKLYPKYDLSKATRVNGGNSSAVNAAINSAFAKTNPSDLIPTQLVVCDHNIDANDTIVMKPGVDLIFINDATLTSPGGLRVFQITHNSRVVCPDFIGVRAQPVGFDDDGVNYDTVTTVGARNFGIIGARFSQIDTSQPAILDTTTSDGSFNMYGQILACESIDCAWFSRTSRFSKCRFSYNKCTSAGYESGRGILFQGGSDNLISMNLISDLVTGANYLCDRTLGTSFDRNTFTHNFYKRIKEEGNSLDLQANSREKSGVIDRVVLVSTSGTYNNAPTLKVIRHNYNDITEPNITNITAGMSVIILRGAHAVKHFKIASCATTSDLVGGKACITITLENESIDSATLTGEGSLNDLAAGGNGTVTLSIQCSATGNVFSNSKYDECYTPGTFYGIGIDNLVCNNIVTRSRHPVSGALNSDLQASFQQRTLAGFGLYGFVPATITPPVAAYFLPNSSVSGGPNPTPIGVAANNKFFNNLVDLPIYSAGRTYNNSMINNSSLPIGTYVSPIPIIGGNNSVAIANELWEGTFGVIGTVLSGVITDSGVAPSLAKVAALIDYDTAEWLKTDHIIKTRDRGSAKFTANGSTAVFNIPHGLGCKPNFISNLVAKTIASKADYVPTLTEDYIVITYTTNPANTAVIAFDWAVEL